MVDSLVALAGVDPAKLGEERLRRADGWTGRQVSRWCALLAEHETTPGFESFEPDAHRRVVRWLEANVPSTSSIGLIHGDFNFGNVLVDRDRGTVVAVVDWELAALGDPLLDLGHLLLTWPTRPGAPGEPHLDARALPPVDAVRDRYLEATGRDVGSVRWFEVLAALRLAVILEGSQVRALRGTGPVEVGARLDRLARFFHARADALVRSGSVE
jgi:aminoglycoside phosphotransferase (APT) family kinase protein